MMRRKARIFHADAASRYLPWMLMLAVFLATIATAGLLSAERTLAQWREDSPRILTVQLPPGDSVESDEAKADALVRRLRAEPGIAAVERVPRESVSRLLRPWLGEGVASADLPLPPVLHVELNPDSSTASSTILELATAVAPDAIVDDHREWQSRLVNYVRWLRVGIIISLVLVIVVASLTALFLTLSRMAIHREAIALLHQLGASDRFVVQGLVRQAGISALISAACGFGVAFLLLLILTAASQEMTEAFLPVLRMSALDWVWLAAVPVAFVLLTLGVTARTAVYHLRRLP